MLETNEPPTTLDRAYRAGTLRGAEGFFRAGQDAAGRWSLLDPANRPFFCKAVHGVRPAVDHGDGDTPVDSVARLRRWGFNALGVDAYPSSHDDGLPYLGLIDFMAGGPAIISGKARLPDVFDGSWPRYAAARATAQITPMLANDPNLLGWIADDCVGWAQPSLAGRPSLLQICLSLEPSFAAYHAAWEFVLALHNGRLDLLARSWNVALMNKEMVRELTRADEGLGTRGYLRDEARWAREFARRYFTTTASAIREVDPHHLVLGCRSEGATSAAVLAESVYPAVDVSLRDWRELPPAVESEQPMPVLAGNVVSATPEFIKLPPAARVLRLTSVEWMLRRARNALERMARHPAVVGYFWGHWQDAPGEQPPFARGLVHANGAEACEHTELLAQFNARAELLRSGATIANIAK